MEGGINHGDSTTTGSSTASDMHSGKGREVKRARIPGSSPNSRPRQRALHEQPLPTSHETTSHMQAQLVSHDDSGRIVTNAEQQESQDNSADLNNSAQGSNTSLNLQAPSQTRNTAPSTPGNAPSAPSQSPSNHPPRGPTSAPDQQARYLSHGSSSTNVQVPPNPLSTSSNDSLGARIRATTGALTTANTQGHLPPVAYQPRPMHQLDLFSIVSTAYR
jgi:hypothetical protein